MKCQVVFPNIKGFSSLDSFCDYTEGLIKKTRGKDHSSTFYLFGEDLLRVSSNSRVKLLLVSLGLCKPENSKKIITHKQVYAELIPHLQSGLGQHDFLVFSLYVSINSSVFNAVYLVGRTCWHFDFKREPAFSDDLTFKSGVRGWELFSTLNLKSQKCVNTSGGCLKNLHLIVCADIDLLPQLQLKKDSLVFVTACALPENQVYDAIQGIGGSGRIFINDPQDNRAWDIPFGFGKKAKPQFMNLGKDAYKLVKFRMN